MRIAVILARKGSVRLPGKNVKHFAGKPMVSWAYERAFGLVSLNLVDRVVVSTDDEAVMALAPANAIIVHRPAHLASSTATSFDAMVHAIETVEKTEARVTHITLLQPTSPLASLAATARVVAAVDSGQAESAVAICAVSDTVKETGWRPKVKANGVSLTDTNGAVQRVDDAMLPTHVITGSAYCVMRDAFLAERSFILPSSRCLGVVVGVSEAVDIDTLEDFQDASLIADYMGDVAKQVGKSS